MILFSMSQRINKIEMKKIILLLTPLMFLLAACPKTPMDGPFEKIRVKFNLIGITGTSSDTSAYVELFYTKADSSGNNITMHQFVKPPYLFGDHVVITEAQKIYYKGNRTSHYYLVRYKYTEGQVGYLKIINHSDKPIEYFIAGTQNLHYGEDCSTYKSSLTVGCNCQLGINEAPRPIYKNAPIYYLLKPAKIPNLDNLQVIKRENGNDYSCYKNNITFKGNIIGDLVVNTPFKVEDVMKLYRAEFNSSKDTLLYNSFLARYSNTRLTKFNPGFGLQSGIVGSPVYYRKIAPQSTFSSSQHDPIINLIEDNSFGDFVKVDDKPDQF